jgi:hypothetical protein
MSEDKKEEQPVANQHLADKIAGKVDEKGNAIDQEKVEDTPAETPKVDKNEHLAEVHKNDNEEGKTTVAGESESDAPAEKNPDVDSPGENPGEETPGEETPGE